MITAALGWLGMAGTFLAYLLLWRGRLVPESLTYALLNTVGGVLGGTASALYGAWPSVASNVVWALVGAQSVATAWRQRGPATGGATSTMLRTARAPELVAAGSGAGDVHGAEAA